ncbi:MAG TPA: DUF192 domain-containing protein [Tepidisphaeraceae bacterium]|nr:DUF192 domain-containing protein [Tepidisphaeraceae bacterium]
MTKRLTIPAALFIALSSFIGCDKQNAPAQTTLPAATRPQSLSTIAMTLGNRQFTLEVASEDSTREIGLMYRDSMAADHGMIFAFPDEEPRGFWMKNTRIPLDIVYVAGNGKIVSIRSMKPFDLTTIESGGAAKYAIELNVGIATSAGLHVGDSLQIPESVTKAAK